VAATLKFIDYNVAMTFILLLIIIIIICLKAAAYRCQEAGWLIVLVANGYLAVVYLCRQ